MNPSRVVKSKVGQNLQINNRRNELFILALSDSLLCLSDLFKNFRRNLSEPLAGLHRMSLCRFFPLQNIPRRLLDAQKLLSVAPFGLRISRQILTPLFLYPASGSRKAIVRKVI